MVAEESEVDNAVGDDVGAVALFAAGIGLIKFSKFFKENPAAMLIIFGIFGGFFLR